jgi:MFS family permease
MTATVPRVSGKRGKAPFVPSRWVALAVLACAQLMLVLDVTVVNVALPDIGVALHLERGELPWVMTIYTVFFGGLMLLGGRIADLIGARRMTLVLVTAGTAAAIYGLINAGSHGWAAASTVLPLVLAVAVWAVFAVIERRASRPLLAVGLLGRRAVLAGSFLMLAATGLLVGGFFLGSFALQHAHGYSALHVGLVFLPVAVATIAGAQAGTQVLTRISARTVAAGGLALAAAGYALAARWPQPAVMVTGLSIAALGIGATFVTAFTASLTDAAAAEGGLRSALVNTFHELGGAVGVGVLSSAAGAGLVMAHLGSHDFARAFTVGAVGAAVCLAIAAVLVPAVLRKPAG